MRLWHKDLIEYLPKQQLLGQWRECCLIAKNIREKGLPNHILVNPIMNYPIEHFVTYCCMVYGEMSCRNYNVRMTSLSKHFNEPMIVPTIPKKQLFEGWHNRRYLVQCLANLEEKYDRGGITYDEWAYILENTNHVRGKHERRSDNIYHSMQPCRITTWKDYKKSMNEAIKFAEKKLAK